MDRKILYISSFREDIVEKFSYLLRELGRRTKRPLWGKGFSQDEDVKCLLYLDSGGRGSLQMMTRSMSADVVEYIFADKISGEYFLLLSGRLKSECRDGAIFYKSSKEMGKTIGNRVKNLERICGCNEVFSVEPSPLEKSYVYSAHRSEVKKNLNEACYTEGSFSELMKRERLPSVIIADAFTQGGVFALLENAFGKPIAVHIMNENSEIYAPYMSLEKEIFIETEEFVKEALFAVGRWLIDSGEGKCAEKLISAYENLSRGEELMERTCASFMDTSRRKR